MLFIKSDEFKVVANALRNSEIELHIEKDRINFIDSDSSYRASLTCVDTRGFEGSKWCTRVSLHWWWQGVPSNARAAISLEQADKGFIIYYLFFGESYMSMRRDIKWVA